MTYPALADLQLLVEDTPTGLVNRIENPLGELGGWGWVTPLPNSYMIGFSRNPFIGSWGGPVVQYTKETTGASNFTSEAFPITPGQYIAARIEVVDTGPLYIRMRFEYLDANGVLISSGTQSAYSTGPGTVTRTPVLMPLSGVTQARLRFDVYASTSGDSPTGYHSVTFTRATVATAPTSAELTGLEYIEPVPYTDVIGPTGNIRIERSELNVSTLEATIQDADLDPSQDDLIRPGKKIRLVAPWNIEEYSLSGEYVLYSGEVLGAKVSYDPLKGTARITLTAVDNASRLAQSTRPQGVGTIAGLPFVLEGAGVPWSINGSGNQVAVATVVATNENASALDQVAITRDSRHGYAWVDRLGVIHVNDPGNESGRSFYEGIDEDHYNPNLDVSFDVERCINEVTIKHLRPNLATGETVEVPYGPYRDQNSIDEWGVHRAEFTVQGLTDNEATMQAFANTVFAANATPQERINSIQIPVRDDTDAWFYGDIDLYDEMEVSNTNLGIVNQTCVITSITHEIRAGWGWLITLGFATEGGVAAPQKTPPVANASGTPGTPGNPGDTDFGRAGFIEMHAGALPAGYLNCDGGTFSSNDYPLLAQVVGDTFGAHVGTTYRLPDLRDRFPVGVGQHALGSSDGQAYGSGRTDLHLHPNHQHNASGLSTGAASHSGNQRGSTTGTGSPRWDTFTDHTHNVTGSTGSAGSSPAHPRLAVRFIIRAVR